MSEPIYTVELCCDGQVLETMEVPGQVGAFVGKVFVSKRLSPRDAALAMLSSGFCTLLNPKEDYLRVTDPAGSVWYWHYLNGNGKLVRLLRPPVSPGSLPPSP